MKLLITQSNLTLKGGAERVVLEIAKHYKAKIYTAEYNKKQTFEEFEDLDIEIVGWPGIFSLVPYNRASQGISYGMSFYSKKIYEDYDIINAHTAPSHWIRNKNERVLWYCHTPLREVYDLYKYRLSMKKPLEKPLYSIGAITVRSLDKKVVKKIEGIVANSNNTRGRIEKYFGRKDVEVINPGVDFKKYSNNGDQKYFFYPSRFSPNKRQDYAIKAFSIFKKKYKNIGYKLVLAGSVSQDKFYQKYYEKVRDLARHVGNVEIIGNANDNKIIDLMSKSTAVLYTPIDEDFGLVPLESMASMKPIIAVKQGGPKETIIDKKTGYLIENEKEMAEMMNFVLEHPKIVKDIGKNGRKHVKLNYSWNVFFKKFDKKVKEIAKIKR